MEPARSLEPTTSCGVCGSPKPLAGKFCRACNHYDTWSERSPLLSALRQILVGTILVGLVSVFVNAAAEKLIKSSDRREAKRERLAVEEQQRIERQKAAYEALHEELRAVRERLIRGEYRLTNEGRRCPFVGADSPARCVEYIRGLRQQVHEELFSLDWTTPLLFAQIDARSGDDARSSATVELALDTVVTVIRDNRDTVDGLDVRWAVECGGDRRSDGTCDRIWECRRKYASAAAHCMSYVSCATFDAEARLLAMMSGMKYEHVSAGCQAIRTQRAECAAEGAAAAALRAVFGASRGGSDRPVSPGECERLGDGEATAAVKPADPRPADAPMPAPGRRPRRGEAVVPPDPPGVAVIPPDPPDRGR